MQKNRFLLVLISLFLLLPLLLGLGGGLTPGRAAASLLAPATLTPTRTATPTATLSALVLNLKRQLTFSIGGGATPFCPRPDRLPSVSYQRARWDHRQDLLCLYDFRAGETVTIKIFDPANNLAASIPYTIRDAPYWGFDVTVNLVSLPVLPYQAPAGRWTIRVEGPSGTVQGRFSHPPDGKDYTLTRSMRPGSNWIDAQRMRDLQTGDTLLVDGTGYGRNRQLPVAIYRQGEPLNLVTAQLVRSDAFGRFSAGFLIDQALPPGAYYVVVDQAPDQETLGLPSVKYGFRVVRLKTVCPGAPPTQLETGRVAMVNAGPPNNVREKAGLSERKLGNLQANETLEILAGPKCADGMVWWKVYSLNTGLDGWTAEGRLGDPWLSWFSYSVDSLGG